MALIIPALAGLLALLGLVAVGRAAHWTRETADRVYDSNQRLDALVSEAKSQGEVLRQMLAEQQKRRTG